MSELNTAAGESDVNTVKMLLDSNKYTHDQLSIALVYACVGIVGTYEMCNSIVQLLLSAGADVHIENDNCLQSACLNGHAEIVRTLIDAGADVHANNNAALRYAASNGDVFLRKPRESMQLGTSLKFTSGSNFWLDISQMLLDAGANADVLSVQTD